MYGYNKTGLSVDQQKALLKATRYHLDLVEYPRLYGRVIGFASDHRGFGGIVIFKWNGNTIQRGFYGVNPQSMRVVHLGAPPPRN